MSATQRMNTEYSVRLLEAAKRADPAELAAHIGAADAPPLTAEQRDRLAPLLATPCRSDASPLQLPLTPLGIGGGDAA